MDIIRLFYYLYGMAEVTYAHLVELPLLREFYRLAWRLFGVNVAIISPDGRQSLYLGTAGRVNPFCAAVNNSAVGHRRCVACDRMWLRRAVAAGRSLRYRCYLGLREFMIPIVVEGRVVSLLQSGQVWDAPPNARRWQGVARKLEAGGIDPHPLRDLYLRGPVMAEQVQRDLMTLLGIFGNEMARTEQQRLLIAGARFSPAVNRALTFVREHLAEPIALGEVAAAAGLSRRHLCRMVRSQTGETVLGHVHRLRVARACALLRTTQQTCAAVAYEVGFGTIQQFNAVFKRLMGTTPRRWRSRQRAETAAP